MLRTLAAAALAVSIATQGFAGNISEPLDEPEVMSPEVIATESGSSDGWVVSTMIGLILLGVLTSD